MTPLHSLSRTHPRSIQTPEPSMRGEKKMSKENGKGKVIPPQKNLGKIPKTETKTHDDDEKEPLLLYPPPLRRRRRRKKNNRTGGVVENAVRPVTIVYLGLREGFYLPEPLIPEPLLFFLPLSPWELSSNNEGHFSVLS
ncbi:hypothetical protein HNY73_011840 [Argiope bruennichi]|uniref:Uncharacterized protein n=1 Tax=Argiope bruennichi TaxID=94029 RepID=A0A8T0EXI9_ARGBR|nr:hypothetical protein HNY73_011840 [Argiope bruennichi]